MKQSLPGIVAISYLPCAKLPANMQEKSLCGITITVLSTLTSLQLHGDASCEAVMEQENNLPKEEVTLTFTTTDEVPRSTNIAFVVVDANNQAWAIGSKEEPYPAVNVTTQIDTETNVYSVEVKYVAEKGLVKVVV